MDWMRKMWVELLIVLIVTFCAAAISLPEFAKSDGMKRTIPFVYPYATLADCQLHIGRLTMALLALGQFPAYGIVLAVAERFKVTGRVAVTLAVVHLVLGFGCAAIYSGFRQ